MVTHCICARQSFSEVLALARHAGWQEVDEVQAATGCGARCGLCRPYLGAMLQTGQTQFAPAAPGTPLAHGERRARH